MLQDWDVARLAANAGARLATAGTAPGGPARVVIDSREAGPGDLFVGLPGERTDGGRFAGQTLEAGAWGVLVSEEHAGAVDGDGAVLAAADPLAALQRLATAWRRELGCAVIGVTGSTGKTSTKDVLAGMLAPHRRVVATSENLNTEIGLPLVVLSAPAGTEVLVLEMAMRGAGQIAELAQVAEPDVGVITNVGPVHLELLGSVRGDRGRQGRAGGGAGAGRDGGGAGGRAAARAPPPRRPGLGHLRARRRRRRAAARPAAPVRFRAHAPQRAGGARGRARRRRRAGGRGRGAPLAAARPARAAGLGGGRRERLLQRQPDVDARGPRRPRRVRAGSQGRRPGRHARARPGRGALPRGDRRARSRRTASTSS